MNTAQQQIAPNIFDYVDYRVFIKDMIEFQRARDRDFSFRKFAKKSGLASPGHIHLIMAGKTAISETTAAKLAKGFELSKIQRQGFLDLVLLANSESETDRQHLTEKILSDRSQHQRTKLDREQYAYYTHWYYPAIREMVALSSFKFDPVWIASQLAGTVSPTQVAQALRDLFALGLIKSKGAEVVQAQPAVTTGDTALPEEMIAHFHAAMMDRAKEAQSTIPEHLREVSGITITVDSSQIESLKDEIIQFRKSLFRKYGEAKPEHDAVVQVALQMFPLTKSATKNSQR